MSERHIHATPFHSDPRWNDMECLDLRQSAKISQKKWSLVTFCLAMGFYIQWIPVANRDHWALTEHWLSIPVCHFAWLRIAETCQWSCHVIPIPKVDITWHYIPQTSENERILHIHHIREVIPKVIPKVFASIESCCRIPARHLTSLYLR